MKPGHRLGGQGDVEAEFIEFPGEAGGEAGPFDAVEVVGAEVGVGDAAAEHPVGGGEDRRGDRDDGFARVRGAP